MLGILEIGARMFYKDKNTLDYILSIIKQSPDLIWTQQPNLNIKFENTSVKTNNLGFRENVFPLKKNANTTRILCLGGSSTFGWGVEADQTYSSILNSQLKNDPSLKENVEVFNAGIIGYSSFQGLKLLESRILELSPDIITISYLVNDIDKLRFYRNNGLTDKELPLKNNTLIALENALENSAFYIMFKKMLSQAQGKTPYFYGTSQNLYPKKRRVTPEEYRENISSIINIAKEKGIKIVLIKMPILNPPKSKNPEFDPSSSAEDYFNKAKNAKLKNDLALADKYFKEAKRLELVECVKIIQAYYGVLEDISEKYNVILVDAVKAFEKHEKEGTEQLFVNPDYDLVHPSYLGHKIIANELANEIKTHKLISFSQ